MKVFVAVLFLAILTLCLAKNQDYGEFCEKGDTCQGDTVCERPKNCQYGKCSCEEGHTRSTGNSCKKLKKLNEGCQTNSDCYDGDVSVSCSNNKCQCNGGQSPMKGDKGCAKMVGDSCENNNDCSGGVRMECHESECKCKASYKEEDKTCMTYELGEDCSGGKTCVTGQCQGNKCSCVNNLVAYLDRHCIHKDAKTGLGAGDDCTPWTSSGSNAKYCGKDLVCKTCPNQNSKKVCVGAASAIQSGLLVLALSALFAVFHI